MHFEQSQKQQAALAPVMQRSLKCLQMSSYDLFRYVQDEAMWICRTLIYCRTQPLVMKLL